MANRYLIINGDCRRGLIDLSKVDAVVTDPTYGLGECAGPQSSWASRPSKWRRAVGHGQEDWDAAPASLEDLMGFDGPMAVWGGNYFLLPPSRGWLTWYKPDAPPSMADLEMCWTNRDMNARQFSWSIGATNAERVGHPTQKPVALMRWTIQELRLPLDSLIYDPYCGSGSTLIAALAEGHRCIGVEIDPRYCEVARRRIERPHAPVPRPSRDTAPLPLFQGLADQ